MPAADNPKHILIVDHDVAAVEPLRQKLCDAGFVARSIAGASAAARSVAERPPDLVIMDWNMPGFAELAMIEDLRRVRMSHAIRLIFISALSSEPDVVAGFDLGADDYIAKPFSVREVVARVFAILRSPAGANT
jgi:DNA-binding response OmpR family regulator